MGSPSLECWWLLSPTYDELVTTIHTKITDGEYLSDGDTDSIVLGITLAGNQDKNKDKSESLGGPQAGDHVLVTFQNGVFRNLKIKGIVSSGSIISTSTDLLL